MPTLKLTYFDAPGRAEPIRCALRLSGLPFEDIRLKFPEFMAAKAQGALPLGSVPVLEVDGIAVVQTAAILRYVARIGDSTLYPTAPWAALVVDSVLDTFNDTLSNALTPSLFERDTEKKLAMRAAFAAGPMARAYAYVESLLERSGGPFIGANTLTIADLVVASQVLAIRSGALDGLTNDHLAPYPRVNALADAYLAHPGIRALSAS
jgi:glutathione S-transferase